VREKKSDQNIKKGCYMCSIALLYMQIFMEKIRIKRGEEKKSNQIDGFMVG